VDGSAAGALPRRIAAGVELPMRPHRVLNWASVAPNGLVLVHDDDGQLFGAGAATEWAWVPLCDTKHAAAHPELMSAGPEGAAGEQESAAAGAGGKPRMSRETRDSFWPIDVAFASPAAVKASGVDDGQRAIAAPGAVVPILQAALCKSGGREPPVTSPRPLASWIPLRFGVVDPSGRNELARLDEAFLRHETYRMQRAWMLSQGLAPASGDSLSLAAANASAAASLRGEVADDAGTALAAEVGAGLAEGSRYAVAIDKSVLLQVDELLRGGHEYRAAQLAARLHVDKSFALAQRVAGKHGSAGTAERYNQGLAARQALLAGEVLPQAEVGGAAATAASAGAVAALGGPAALAAVAAAQEEAAAAAGAGGARGFGLGRRVGAGAAAAPAPAPAPASSTGSAGTGAGLARGYGARSSAYSGSAAAAAAGAGGEGVADHDSTLPPTAAALAGLAAASGSSPADALSGVRLPAGFGGKAAGAGAMPARPAAAAAAAPRGAGAGSAGGANPFASKAGAQSPRKRHREAGGLEALGVASPPRPGAGSAAGAGGAVLNRQSSFAQEAREHKRARTRDELH
jgi:hypothetical protein